MVELYGRTLTRREVAEHTGMLAQVAGVRLMTLGRRHRARGAGARVPHRRRACASR